MSSSLNLPVLGGILVLLGFVGTAVYNTLFHPLAKYPGPILAKFTVLYEFFAVKTGDHHLWLYDLHQKYGPVVRVAPNRLSYNTVDALHSIYGDRKGNIRKSGYTETLVALVGERNVHTMNERHSHAVRRRLIAHAFSEEALRSSEKFIILCVQEWCRLIGAKATSPSSWTTEIDMQLWAGLLTDDVLAELCFGETFGACQKGWSDIARLAVDGSKQAQLLCWLPVGDVFYGILKRISAYGKKREWEMLKPQIDYENKMQAMMTRRMDLFDSSRKDFFHYISQAKDAETGQTITSTQMRAEAGVLFGAGVDTSATCIAACMFYLTRYPDVLAKLTSEIRSTFSTVEQITQGPELSSLVYLRACIDETLRITPPVPGPLLRQVAAHGMMIDGDVVPCGTEVSVPCYAIHHNETYFPDPFAFKPERWLSGSGDDAKAPQQAHKDAFCAFSLGPRVCIGRNLAYLDMTLALARLLFSFDVRPAPSSSRHHHVGQAQSTRAGGKPEYGLKDWFITEREGPFVQFKAR